METSPSVKLLGDSRDLRSPATSTEACSPTLDALARQIPVVPHSKNSDRVLRVIRGRIRHKHDRHVPATRTLRRGARHHKGARRLEGVPGRVRGARRAGIDPWGTRGLTTTCGRTAAGVVRRGSPATGLRSEGAGGGLVDARRRALQLRCNGVQRGAAQRGVGGLAVERPESPGMSLWERNPGSTSGGGGIRTLGTAYAVQRFSRPPRSTTPAPLLGPGPGPRRGCEG